VVEVEDEELGLVLDGSETSLLVVASAIAMPVKASPATSSMPLPSSNCAWCRPAGFPAGKGETLSAAKALVKVATNATETIKGNFIIAPSSPVSGKAKKPNLFHEQAATIPVPAAPHCRANSEFHKSYPGRRPGSDMIVSQQVFEIRQGCGFRPAPGLQRRFLC
jgi:hypothetical protein